LTASYACEEIQFHGNVPRPVLEAALDSASILVNPHLPSTTLSQSYFPFKLAEYLGFGKPIVSTYMGVLGRELEGGIRYCESNAPAMLAEGIEDVRTSYNFWCARARECQGLAWATFGLEAVGTKVGRVLFRAMDARRVEFKRSNQ
jgi:glycosyltransferase involved in cell wall biosynthesis